MATDHNIRQLIINKVPTKAQYDQMVKNADELYLTPDDSNGLPDQSGQSGKFLKTNGTNASWDNVPAGTVTSVRVQAGTGLSSSQSTAQTSTLNTTISIASGYKLPTTTEWGNKQDVISDLSTIRDGASAGATAVQPGDLATVATTGAYSDLSGTPSLSTVAISGSYNDLSNKPTIPTVNDAVLTIQKNGATVSTFTANSATNAVANITVPTKVSDLTNDSGYITGITAKNVTTALGYTPYDSTNPSGYISGITANNVTVALGYTPYNSTNPNGYTSNTGTVKSVQVQAGTGLTSSTSTAQNTTLNTTISIASGYKLPTTTEWENKQNTISDLGYIRNQVAKVDDKISAIDITDSGDSLPSASGYLVNDTFLNKTDKKLYTVETPAWQLNSNVTSKGITVDLTNGVATGFNSTSSPGGTTFTNIVNNYQKNVGDNPIYFHFKTGNTVSTYGYIIAFETTPSYYKQYLGISGIAGSKLQINCFTYYQGNLNNLFTHQLFDTSLEPNTEYYIYITYNGSEYISTLSSTGYNINILETSTIEESTTQYGTKIYYGGFLDRWPTYPGITVYLADSMGEFVVPDGALTWDSGTSLEDNTQYNDTTNEKTLYYNNNILYDSGDSLPSQSGQSGKYLTTNGSSVSWANVDALPSQSGQSGKYLTTNGTTASWATVDALPSQSGNSGKFLTTNGTSASWTTVSIPTVNNSTITIQKNSTTVDSFTLNQSSDKTINISVPTKTSDLNNDSGYTTNTGTVTSVQVQAGTGLASSTSTAQNTTLNTTISIASGYKLPTTTEWNNKQDVLPSQSGNNGKFLTTNGNTMSWSAVSSVWTYDSTNKILEIS
jgi:hypothetical protein